MINLSATQASRFAAVLRAIAVAVPAGYIFHLLHTPIPWMIGPMVAVAALNLWGVRMHSPPYARQMGQVILGSAVGLYFTPSVVRELAGNFPVILAATVAVFIVGGLGAVTLSRASGVDGKSTFFASIPGGAMAMAVLAEKYGAEVSPVAVAHSLRVSLVVILIPFALTYGGIPLVASAYRPEVPLDYQILFPWLLAGCIAGEVSERLHMHNGYLLAPIFLGAGLTMSGVQLSAVPRGFTDFAQLMFGLVLGARYERAFFVRHKLFIPFALLNSMFILFASVVAGMLLSWMFDLPLATMLLATSPGGLAEMTITAQALKIGVPLVVAFHLFRVIVVNMGTQYIYTFSLWARDSLSARREIARMKTHNEKDAQASPLVPSRSVPPTIPNDSE
ncbi:MAG TPA: AbrB family transcriptional regulator [Candidatus Binatia bacterium]|nr:AbrB family transcriptional regulator [Candidatus Binatia bacterium]